VKTRLQFEISGGNTVAEVNFAYALSDHPQSAQWSALFDQWSIPMFSVTFYSQQGPGDSSGPLEIHTALDFDNVTAISNGTDFTSIDRYDNVEIRDIAPGLSKSVTRSILPCMKLPASGSTSAVMARNWCDSGVPGTKWFGIRSQYQAPTVSIGVVTEATLVFAFRGRI
jgi:hypothetical protein